MNPEDYKNIESLLPKYCEGLATEEECRLVKIWAAESEENNRILKQEARLLMATETLRAIKKVDVEKDLLTVKERLNRKKNISWIVWTQRVAAILFVPLAFYVLADYLKGEKENIQMIEVKTNPGMTASVILPDSTRVKLNSESVLRYPSSFDGAGIRKVELQGEGYFRVTKNEQKHFIVSTSHLSQIEVLGTTFNVEAYDNSDQVSATLIEGKVNFSFVDGKKMKNVMLNPHQKVIYDSKGKTVRLYATSGETETSWIDGRIFLNNTPFDEVLNILEKRFNVQFLVQKDLSKDYFTGTFTSQRLDRIMEYISLTSSVRWKYKHDADINQTKTQIIIY